MCVLYLSPFPPTATHPPAELNQVELPWITPTTQTTAQTACSARCKVIGALDYELALIVVRSSALEQRQKRDLDVMSI
jgi:hypothetical protein